MIQGATGVQTELDKAQAWLEAPELILRSIEGLELRSGVGRRGKLVVFEGIDFAGKSTQAVRLVDRLLGHGRAVFKSKWASSKLLKPAIRKAKDRRELSPTAYSLLHAADMVIRFEKEIAPALERGETVVCDRYVYTSYVRDRLRGADARIIEGAFKQLRAPDLSFFCSITPEEALKRIPTSEKGLTFYGAGLDIGYAANPTENARRYFMEQARLYEKVMMPQPGYTKLDMSRTPEEIATEVETIVLRAIS